MIGDTIFDVKEKCKELEDLYNPSSSSSLSRGISSMKKELINHFGASLHHRICCMMEKEINNLQSPASQTMMDIYHQSGAKSWIQFVNNSSLQYLRKNNQETFSILQNYQSQFTKNIYAPLSQYISSPHNIFKGDADHLIEQISSIYNHLKLRKISPNCCMQIDLRCQHDIIVCSCGQSNDEELEWNPDEYVYEGDNDNDEDDIDYNEYKNASNVEKEEEDLEVIPDEMDTFNLISDGNIDCILRQCVMPLDGDTYCYKRYEILLNGSSIKSFEAISNNNIPQCAFTENAPLCLIFNSTASAQQIFNELCRERGVGLITVSFHVYNKGMNVYLYVINNKGKLFGSRIFEDDLISLIPLLFENSNINKIIINEIKNYLQFKPDIVYKKYYISLIKQVMNENKNNEEKKKMIKLDQLFISKLEEIVNSWNNNGGGDDKKYIINKIKECFIENNVTNYTYFKHHKRKDFIKLLKPYNIKAAAATKLWRAFVIPRENISNDENEVKVKLISESDDDILCNALIAMQQQEILQTENQLLVEKVELLQRKIGIINQENYDLKRVIQNTMNDTDYSSNDESKEDEHKRDEEKYNEDVPDPPPSTDISMDLPSMLLFDDNISFINPVPVLPLLDKNETSLTHSVMDRGLHLLIQQRRYHYQQEIGYLYHCNVNNIYKKITEEASFVLSLLYFYMIYKRSFGGT